MSAVGVVAVVAVVALVLGVAEAVWLLALSVVVRRLHPAGAHRGRFRDGAERG